MWIAFKNLYLWYSEQPKNCISALIPCCELLSKTCIFDILNNKGYHNSCQRYVVNCFQKLVSLIFWTTSWRQPSRTTRLWIAFKNLYLWYSEQRGLCRTFLLARCELLSKTCIFDILNNTWWLYYSIKCVVNCFQKLVSLIFWTTFNYLYIYVFMLWIAFKNLYLWYSEQPLVLLFLLVVCCELLSKTCIFDILNNFQKNDTYRLCVVNCFQKLVSLIFWTTKGSQVRQSASLWIAFKNLYLWYSEQPLSQIFNSPRCCELLSKTCIFDILNNFAPYEIEEMTVVNCFQKLVSLIFWTT